jgi:hypothetical protein
MSKEITDNQEGIRRSFCRIQGSRNADVVESPEANIFILVWSYVHTFLKKSEGCSNIYIPSVTSDTEQYGEMFGGVWRKAKEKFRTLTQLKKVAVK